MSDGQTIFLAGLILGLLVLLAIPGWRAFWAAPRWVKSVIAVVAAAVVIAVVVASTISSDESRFETASEPKPAAPSSSPGPGPVAENPAYLPKKAMPPESGPEPMGQGAPPPEPMGQGAPPPAVDAPDEPSGGAAPTAEDLARMQRDALAAEERRRYQEQAAGSARDSDGNTRGWDTSPAPRKYEYDSGDTRGSSGAPPPKPEEPAFDGSRGLSEGAPLPAPESTPTPPPLGGGMPPAADDKEAWDVVPVFYGTDRARADQTERADYGNERGRRLELGRALVTVPRSHKVPQIERPWAIHIPYFDIVIGESEDPNTHFTMKEVKPLGRDEFLELVRARLGASERFKNHALIFVHGYNTTFDFAMFRTAQIAYDLKFDGAPFSYSWPSGGGMASYTFDRERSGQSVKFLREYIDMVIDKTGAQAISVVAHSMGNQPMLQVLKDIRAARPSGIVFNQIILAAPDVDRDSFGDIANELQGLAKNITLYAAENDSALAVSRRVNGGSRAGDIPITGPLIIPGVDTLDVTSVSTDSLGINHSGYAENNKLLTDIGLLVAKGEAPGIRLPSLEVVPLGAGKYWRFPKITDVPPPPKTDPAAPQ